MTMQNKKLLKLFILNCDFELWFLNFNIVFRVCDRGCKATTLILNWEKLQNILLAEHAGKHDPRG